jgi:S1-C subfamily serine protease
MNNMGDISNAINSLMDGSRFDVEVLRDGEQVPLSYVVR